MHSTEVPPLSKNSKIRAGVAAMMLLIVSGALTGYLLGRLHTRIVTETRLAGDSAKIQTLVDALLDEANKLLDTLNASHASPCSEAEIASFRKYVYRSVNQSDVGRTKDGRMVCSALFSKEEFPKTPIQPTMTREDGVKILTDPAPYAIAQTAVISFQKGSFFVVEDPNFVKRLKLITPSAETTGIDAISHLRGRPTGLPDLIPGAIEDRNAQGRIGDQIYVTRCSRQNGFCTTAFGSFAVALAANRGQLFLDTALGVLAGAVLGLVVVNIGMRRRSMNQQLLRAIRRDRINVVYQPIVELGYGRFVGAEALARWNNEDGLAVSPDVFVRLAEEGKFVDELTELVVRHVLSDFGEKLRSDPDFSLHVNITATDLQTPRLLPMLEQLLAAEGISPKSLAIEITETSMARNPVAMEALRQLRQRGHSVHIDDFGTGYSNLAYLHDLPTDALKIDKTFTHSIGTGAVTAAILPQILALAETLSLRVIAEGIETEEQANYFSGLKRPVLGQGWLFGWPVPADLFLISLEADRQNAKVPAEAR